MASLIGEVVAVTNSGAEGPGVSGMEPRASHVHHRSQALSLEPQFPAPVSPTLPDTNILVAAFYFTLGDQYLALLRCCCARVLSPGLHNPKHCAPKHGAVSLDSGFCPFLFNLVLDWSHPAAHGDLLLTLCSGIPPTVLSLQPHLYIILSMKRMLFFFKELGFFCLFVFSNLSAGVILEKIKNPINLECMTL